MAAPIALLVVLALVFIVAFVFIAAKLERRKAEHRREMQDLVRGRTGRPANVPNTDPDAPQFGGVSSAFTTMPGVARRTNRSGADAADTAALIQQLQTITAIAKGNASTKVRQPGPCTLQINYVDADGVWTTRNVAPYKSGNTNERFHAWCEMRQDRRTFFFSRVQSGIHISTSTRLDRAGVFRHIHPGRRVPADLQ